MSIPKVPGQIPDVGSFRPEMNRSDHQERAADTLSDPLLPNGSFINAKNNFSTSGHTTNKPNRDSHQAAPQSSGSANPVETETQTPTPTPTLPKSRRKAPVLSSESAIGLPPGWLVEDRVRTSGATAGMVDKYYIEPVSGRRFRSKKEVQHYLETGTLKKNKRVTENSEDDVNHPEGSRSRNKKATKNAKRPEMKFDYLNVPDRIEWVLEDANEDAWTPFIGGKKVTEYDKQNWEFEMLHLHH
ncbi:hypothetical protein P3X46_015591 [Hevea brasiliensis]|uniref:MBD domain-containing protein n=1 Tax=Hevea brasiliensis TaxID=3981 RepID=A0ABQ9M0G1_HEVBR|nr:methyl-CpG-binding domain-containing protein 5 [Hevea brasiliensis]KAJ9172343.1 hypothetical protein P3X46_015591 [Hevea brasiliensis]